VVNVDATEPHRGHALDAVIAIPVVMEGDVEVTGVVRVARTDQVNILVSGRGRLGSVGKFAPGNGDVIRAFGDVNRAVRRVVNRAVVNPDVLPGALAAAINRDAVVGAAGRHVEIHVLHNDVRGVDPEVAGLHSRVGADADDRL